MLRIERQQHILELIEQYGRVEIEKLKDEFDVSGMTIRRDLDKLEKDQQVIRTHGGAISPSSLIQERPYTNKTTSQIKKKKQLPKLHQIK